MQSTQYSPMVRVAIIFWLGFLTGALIIGAVSVSQAIGKFSKASLFNFNSGYYGMEDPDVVMKGIKPLDSSNVIMNGLKGMEDPDVVMHK